MEEHKSMLDAVLFDLDGTLLPMDQDAFLARYFKEIALKFADRFPPDALTKALWEGSLAMIQNDGTIGNAERFWQVFSNRMGPKVLSMTKEFDAFYENEFARARVHTWPQPLAAKAVSAARACARQVVLATNPVFPQNAVHQRLAWAGLSPQSFDWITSYETASFCKPNPAYYREILSKIGADASKSLMIGNDVGEDALPAKQTGMQVFIVTDCLLGAAQALETVPNGNFEQMLRMLETVKA